MKIVSTAGRDDLARVYVGELADGRAVEFAEALEPPHPRERKWVVIVSTWTACPVRCLMCDAGMPGGRRLSAEEILGQVDYAVRRRYADGAVPAAKFKVQFARVGEPALNAATLEALGALRRRFTAPGLLPCVSTVAPGAGGKFFENLLRIRKGVYGDADFQLQFSLHTTDERLRDRIIPARKWPFERIAAYGAAFFTPGRRKVALNFAPAAGWPVDAEKLRRRFDPACFIIKLTPLNPTYGVAAAKLRSAVGGPDDGIAASLRAVGFDVIVSIGEDEENLIGSNCGQYIRRHLAAAAPKRDAYTYPAATP